MEILTAVEAADRIRPDDTLGVPLGPGQPPALLEALGERDGFASLTVFTALLLAPYRLFTLPGVRHLSGFFGPVERGLVEAGHDVHFVPADFRRFAAIAETMRPRVVATAVAPPDAGGRYSLALHAGATVDEILRCGRDPERLLIVEVNQQLPRTRGLPPEHPHGLYEGDIDVLVETDRPIFSLPESEPSDVDRRIAEHARAFIPVSATLQCGIGAIPDAVVRMLAEGKGGAYGIHSEMFTTGLMRLHQAGKVTNEKGLHDGVSITTFALGTEDLYRWLDEREDVAFLPVDEVNDPSLISRNRHVVSINGAISVDLHGQIAADMVGSRQHSGIGGHEDFVSGASFSHCGTSLVCLPSLAHVDGKPVSRITAHLAEGQAVTTPRHHVDTVVTEHGAAELAGLTVDERREALIAIAHPDFREELKSANRGRSDG